MQTFPIIKNHELVITGATNATPIVVTTSVAHNMQTGETVDVRDVLGPTNANGEAQTITRISATTFSLDGTAGNGDYVGGGGIVRTRDAPSRMYDALVGVNGDIIQLWHKDHADQCNFSAAALIQPDLGPDEDHVHVHLYGRPSPECLDWFLIADIDETDTWTQTGSTVWVSQLTDLRIYPEMFIHIEPHAGSVNDATAWLTL